MSDKNKFYYYSSGSEKAILAEDENGKVIID